MRDLILGSLYMAALAALTILALVALTPSPTIEKGAQYETLTSADPRT